MAINISVLSAVFTFCCRCIHYLLLNDPSLYPLSNPYMHLNDLSNPYLLLNDLSVFTV